VTASPALSRCWVYFRSNEISPASNLQGDLTRIRGVGKSTECFNLSDVVVISLEEKERIHEPPDPTDPFCFGCTGAIRTSALYVTRAIAKCISMSMATAFAG
jgi:hypothetical protein